METFRCDAENFSNKKVNCPNINSKITVRSQKKELSCGENADSKIPSWDGVNVKSKNEINARLLYQYANILGSKIPRMAHNLDKNLVKKYGKQIKLYEYEFLKSKMKKEI